MVTISYAGIFSPPSMCYRCLLLLFLLIANGGVATADSQISNDRIVIVTNEADNVYHAFGDDLRRLGALHGFEIVIRPSEGSLGNLVSIVNDDTINLAFVQADVPSWIADRLKESDRPGSKIRKFLVKVRDFYPLYSEWVQVVARRGITSLADLEGRKVATGSPKSGTFLTMGNLSRKENIPFELVPIAGVDALAQLRAGKIDAVATVSGFPTAALQSLEIGEDYHLLPIVLTHPDPIYTSSEIPVNTYAWQKEAIKTVSVKTLLVTYDYSQEMPICQRLIRFSDIIKKNVDWLRTHGHARWKEVDLEYSDSGGKRFLRSRCIESY